ncbi:hypothetical protein QMK19_07190 [Streptomyces sp. H10-C2]|uniref:hypothetical protein n=1 Tax=unclassified Streptomyces TaxID=2593676 RepID=UPI0024BB8AC1|nr:MULTISPECIES: hypothetical protein [unclassified Streptomyces]MDJ0341185.1 hypothetical protein [Streptomyces sp. PH10-H1]MDJ0369462.1 hypothetical protein [Streptomyces sp. H10-C2]
MVTKGEVVSDLVCRTLGFLPEEEGLNVEGIGISSGPDWWIWRYVDNISPEGEEPVAALAAKLAGRADAIRELRQSGYDVRVDMSGTVETGSTLRMSPAVLFDLRALGVPVTFTTVLAGGPGEDPLAWLD